MMDPDTECQIGETMAEVLRERLVELETVEATGDATEDTVSRPAGRGARWLPAQVQLECVQVRTDFLASAGAAPFA